MVEKICFEIDLKKQITLAMYHFIKRLAFETRLFAKKINSDTK